MSYYIETSFDSPNSFDDTNANETFTQCKHDRRFGIELEFNYLSDEYDVEQFAYDTCFSGKEDCSTEGGEFVSPPLRGDTGFEEIRNACNLADSFGWEAEHRNCGLHLHMDMNNETMADIKKIVLGYYYFEQMFLKLVSPDRLRSTYSRPVNFNRSTATKSDDMSDMARDRSRYEWLNLRAYRNHGTLEIRLLEGTQDADKIKDWINLNLCFVELMKSMTIGQITYRFGGKNTKQLYKELRHQLGADADCLERTHQRVTADHGDLINA